LCFKTGFTFCGGGLVDQKKFGTRIFGLLPTDKADVDIKIKNMKYAKHTKRESCQTGWV
jgi:hypothetical protein